MVWGEFKLVGKKWVLEKGLYTLERIMIIECHRGLYQVDSLQLLGLPGRAQYKLSVLWQCGTTVRDFEPNKLIK
jgi:hypothetical protein